uniref:Ribosomal biogenesis factor n=1 Tax=Moschus moschiferus TaxID=68415 RepID=A0A8C6CRE1_MOSMO
MAKNKLRGQKSREVHLASQKSFKVTNKAKPVTTNLKKINTCHENVPVNVDEATRLMAQL